MVSWKSSSQIVTSKKEAQKKGIYSYSDTNTNATVTGGDVLADNTPKESRLLGYEPVKKADIKKADKRDRGNKTEVRKGIKILSNETDADFIPAPYENYLAQQIVNNAMEFEGVRYRGGGTTKDGMDCSGMVYATFNIFDISLPRSSHEMAKAGKEIKLDEVRKGDLLFFDNNPRRSRINHVGIVIEVTEEGEVKFLHSSTSSGVMVSSMNEPYHSRTFVQATRVIED